MSEWSKVVVVGAATWAAWVSMAMAQPAQFTLENLTVNGSARVAAEGLNDRGAIVGYYEDSASIAHGFILSNGTTTLLPPFLVGTAATPALPTGINNSGQIVGFAGSPTTGSVAFFWQNGAYVPTGPVGPYKTPTGSVCYAASAAQINGRGMANYPCQTSSLVQDFIGTPGAFKPFQPFSSQSRVLSLNDKGDVAGETQDMPTRNSFNSFVLFGTKGHLTYLSPGSSANGGYINNFGQVAGSYIDKFGRSTGFIFLSGKYTKFHVGPTAEYMTVAGINNAGRVVGSYLDSKSNVQTIFLFNGRQVSTFGSFPPNHSLSITLNNNGVILLTEYMYGTPGVLRSYRVVCRGSG